MSTRISLPTTGKKTGCYGLSFPDGTHYDTRPGGSVVVEDHHAAQVSTSTNARLGLLSATQSVTVRGGRTRRCEACGRDWHAWTTTCHSCGSPARLLEPGD